MDFHVSVLMNGGTAKNTLHGEGTHRAVGGVSQIKITRKKCFIDACSADGQAVLVDIACGENASRQRDNIAWHGSVVGIDKSISIVEHTHAVPVLQRRHLDLRKRQQTNAQCCHKQ